MTNLWKINFSFVSISQLDFSSEHGIVFHDKTISLKIFEIFNFEISNRSIERNETNKQNSRPKIYETFTFRKFILKIRNSIAQTSRKQPIKYKQ